MKKIFIVPRPDLGESFYEVKVWSNLWGWWIACVGSFDLCSSFAYKLRRKP
jgi:hypothetical protein